MTLGVVEPATVFGHSLIRHQTPGSPTLGQMVTARLDVVEEITEAALDEDQDRLLTNYARTFDELVSAMAIGPNRRRPQAGRALPPAGCHERSSAS